MGNVFSVCFLHFLVCTGLGSGFRLLFALLCNYARFVSSVLTSFDLVWNCVTGFCWAFLSEIILDICELILSLLEFRVAMQCSDAITCVLESPSLLPLWGNQIQGNFYTAEKKNCKRDDSRGKVLLWLSWVLPMEL